MATCRSCSGLGIRPSEEAQDSPCRSCGGLGEVREPLRLLIGGRQAELAGCLAAVTAERDAAQRQVAELRAEVLHLEEQLRQRSALGLEAAALRIEQLETELAGRG